MTEEGPSTCERCGGELRRVLFPAGIIFKGSGFYKTDSRSASSSSESGSSSSTKPAASAESKTQAGGCSESSAAAPAPSATDSAKKD
jgi:hypothetical protein